MSDDQIFSYLPQSIRTTHIGIFRASMLWHSMTIPRRAVTVRISIRSPGFMFTHDPDVFAVMIRPAGDRPVNQNPIANSIFGGTDAVSHT